MTTSVTINSKELDSLLESIRDKSQHNSPLMISIGQLVKKSVDNSFVNAVDPNGTPWKPLKTGSRKPLTKTGKLHRSIVVKAVDGSVEIGTTLFYAQYHEFGLGREPMRAFLPTGNTLPADMNDKTITIINDYLDTFFN